MLGPFSLHETCTAHDTTCLRWAVRTPRSRTIDAGYGPTCQYPVRPSGNQNIQRRFGPGFGKLSEAPTESMCPNTRSPILASVAMVSYCADEMPLQKRSRETSPFLTKSLQEVSLAQRPRSMISLSGKPASASAVAPPRLHEWVRKSSGSKPRAPVARCSHVRMVVYESTRRDKPVHEISSCSETDTEPGNQPGACCAAPHAHHRGCPS